MIKAVRLALSLLVLGVCLISCEESNPAQEQAVPEAEVLSLPELQPVKLKGRPLKVVATTSIISDVVAQIGGQSIELTGLMGPGQDPHSYEPAARDLTAVSEADVIFVNGWDLEEALIEALEEIGEESPLVPISAGITPLQLSQRGPDQHDAEPEHTHHRSSADPHVWFDPQNVRTWVENVERVLSELDPANAEAFQQNASAYQIELEDLEAYAEARLGSIPEAKRILVTNHDSLQYFAERYEFEVLGTVLPASSTLAEPSVTELAALIQAMEQHQVCTIFSETTVSDTLAQTVAGELSGCSEVKILKLYTGAVGLPGSGAESYLGMFKADLDWIADGLGDAGAGG